MVDAQKARALLGHYRRYRSYLDRLSRREDGELLGDFVAMGAVQHYLLLLIEKVLDLAGHLISSEGWEAPVSYADAFRVLQEEGVLPVDLADRLKAMARFRNVLVHLYADVDDERVLQTLRGSLEDPDEFVRLVKTRFAGDLRGSD